MTKLILLKQLLYSLKYSQPYILSEYIFNGIIFYVNVGILDMLTTCYTTSLQLSYCQGGHILLTVLNVEPGILYGFSI